MRVHTIVDFNFLYHKYKNAIESGRMKTLTANTENGEVDISYFYYVLKEIEGFRRGIEKANSESYISICFDSKRERGEDSELRIREGQYKANRTKKFNDLDFSNIAEIRDLLTAAGHNIFAFKGTEADDIIMHLVSKYKNEFDKTCIVTPDSDLIMCVDDKVYVNRYKTVGGYGIVNKGNYEQYLEAEFKCHVPYNSLMLYKCTVGDKSDNITGIAGFGKKRFEVLVGKLKEQGAEFIKCNDAKYVEECLKVCGGFLGDGLSGALESLKMVESIDLPSQWFNGGVSKRSNIEDRRNSYMRYNMKSLVE